MCIGDTALWPFQSFIVMHIWFSFYVIGIPWYFPSEVTIFNCLMGMIKVIAIISTNSYFPPTHSCGAIIDWWYHRYHTYLGLPNLFYLEISLAWICSQNHSHDLVSELPEHSNLKRFGHVVANNTPCGTPYYWHFTILNPTGDKQIPNINVLCSFSALGFPIIFQKNRTIFFLLHDNILNILSLCHNKILGPEDIWYKVVNVHNICVCEFLCVFWSKLLGIHVPKISLLLNLLAY